MKPLETNQRVLKWLYAFPPKDCSKRKKFAYIAFALSVFSASVIATAASIIFIYQNVSIDLELTLFSLFHTIAAIQTLYQSVATILLRRKLIRIFDRLSTIYTENDDCDSFGLLKRTNERCEWMWPIYIKYVLGGFFICNVINTSVSVIYCYVTNGHFDTEHVYHLYRFVLPWNQSTPIGYALEIIFDFFCGEIYFISNGALLILFISMCLHHQTFYKMFRCEAEKLNHRDKDRNDAEHLRKMVSFHISVKDWFLHSAGTYSTFILVLLISSMLLLACCVFQVDLQRKHLDFGIIIISMGVTAGTSILFAYCYFGKMSTDCYGKMSDCLYDCNWHELDLKHQKYIVVMMANTQRPIYYHGFGVALLNLETFLKMIRAVYSYYMIFKTLTSE